MNLFIELHQELIRELIRADVDFIVIGGYSVVFHGYKRTTGDIDIWLKPDNNNKEKLLPVLRHFGFEDIEIKQVSSLDFTKHVAFSVGEQPEKMDFLTFINLIKYEDAARQKIIANVDGLAVPFLHLNDLVLSKINTGRPKDTADVTALQEIQKAKPDSGK